MTWMASQLVEAVWLMKRVSSTPRTRTGPTCRTAIPRRASSFARKSVVSRKPRLETSCPLASVRVPGGSFTSGLSSAIAAA